MAGGDNGEHIVEMLLDLGADKSQKDVVCTISQAEY